MQQEKSAIYTTRRRAKGRTSRSQISSPNSVPRLASSHIVLSDPRVRRDRFNNQHTRSLFSIYDWSLFMILDLHFGGGVGNRNGADQLWHGTPLVSGRLYSS